MSLSAVSNLTPADRVIAFAESLRIPTGPHAGQPLRLAEFQKQFIRGTLDPDTEIGVLSIGRGNAKTALAAILLLAGLLGLIDDQPHRQLLGTARVAEQARQLFDIMQAFVQFLPVEQQSKIRCLKSPRLEVRYDAEDGPHHAKVISSDGKSALGASPLLCVMDERAAWSPSRGDELESALLTSLGKVGGKAVIISTSGPDELNAFSRWLDEPAPGVYRQEHRPPPHLPANDVESLLIANPGAAENPPIGASLESLIKMADRAIKRGGSALTSFRNLNRNERVVDAERAVLVTVDQWLEIETDQLPPRLGPCILGLDIGESVSMSAAAYFWPESQRLEVHAWLPHEPDLLSRGQNDKAGNRYQLMADRAELSLIGDKVVPVKEWIVEVFARIHGQPVDAIVCDAYKRALLEEGLQQAGIRTPVIFRRFGWFHGGEDVTRTRNMVLDKKVNVEKSLLLRSAIGDCVVQKDDCGNERLAKGRSTGRIDAVAATVVALAEADRKMAQPVAKPARVAWA